MHRLSRFLLSLSACLLVSLSLHAAPPSMTTSSEMLIGADLGLYAPLANPSFTGVISGASLSLSSGISVTGSVSTGAGNFETTVGNISTGSGVFSGNGSGITTLNASSLSSGTVSNARLDPDLSAIGALTTASFGRNLLTLSNAAALQSAAELGALALLDTVPGSVPANIITPLSPVLWLEANATSDNATEPNIGAAVPAWRSLNYGVGAGGDFAQATSGNRPTITTHPRTGLQGVFFDGDDYLSRTNLSTAAADGHTIIAVLCQPAVNSNAAVVFGSSTDSTWFGFLSSVTMYHAVNSAVSLSSPTFDRVSVFAYRIKSNSPTTTSLQDFWVGQTRMASIAGATAIPSHFNVDNIGSLGGSFNFTGYVFELQVYAQPLSDGQLAALVESLETKWRCEHGIVAIDGNSIVAGSNNGSGWQKHLKPALGSKYHVVNFGVVGQTTTQMLSDVTAQVSPLLGPRLDGKKNVLVVHEMRNDLANGVTLAQAQTNMANYAAAVPHAQIVMTPMIPAYSGFPSSNWTESNKADGNAWLETTFPDEEWLDLEDGWNPLWVNSAGGGDGIHPTGGFGEPAFVGKLITHLVNYQLLTE